MWWIVKVELLTEGSGCTIRFVASWFYLLLEKTTHLFAFSLLKKSSLAQHTPWGKNIDNNFTLENRSGEFCQTVLLENDKFKKKWSEHQDLRVILQCILSYVFIIYVLYTLSPILHNFLEWGTHRCSCLESYPKISRKQWVERQKYILKLLIFKTENIRKKSKLHREIT